MVAGWQACGLMLRIFSDGTSWTPSAATSMPSLRYCAQTALVLHTAGPSRREFGRGWGRRQVMTLGSPSPLGARSWLCAGAMGGAGASVWASAEPESARTKAAIASFMDTLLRISGASLSQDKGKLNGS